MALERRLHDAALNAATAPVNDPHFEQTGLAGGVHVLFDDRRDVARREGVQVELVLDRDPVTAVALERRANVSSACASR
jgi:hypothetical protein